MKLTKKNFEVIARIIKDNTFHPAGSSDIILKDDFIQHLSDYFLSQNANFDPYKFEKTCKE